MATMTDYEYYQKRFIDKFFFVFEDDLITDADTEEEVKALMKEILSPIRDFCEHPDIERLYTTVNKEAKKHNYYGWDERNEILD